MKKLIFTLLLLIPVLANAQRIVPNSAEQVALSYAPLVKKAAPAVVNIFTKKKVKIISPFMNDPFFSQFFGNNAGALGLMREKVENSLGSGVIINPSGLIITNFHVIKGADEIRVVLNDRRDFAAKIVITDQKSDLALLKIETGSNLPFIELGDSDNLEVGDIVLAIGNPFGVGQTVTQGIISALARTTVGISDYQFFIQTDAAINPGNSGGALIDMHGKLAGINTAIFTKTGGSNGIGFATPANMARTVIASAETGGKKIIRPWVGVSVQAITREIADSINYHKLSGVMVRRIYAGGPADRAGIKVGDIILSIDDKEINDEQALRFRVATYKVGANAQFRIFRNGKEFTTPVSMLEAPKGAVKDIVKLKGNHPFSGAVVANISPSLADDLEMEMPPDEGVVITEIDEDDNAGTVGFIPGDVIIKLNNQEIKTIGDVGKILNSKPAAGWVIVLKRGRQFINLTIRNNQ